VGFLFDSHVCRAYKQFGGAKCNFINVHHIFGNNIDLLQLDHKRRF
jgi:hypothetical protein